MDYSKLINFRNSKNYFAVSNGVELLEVREGYAKCKLDVTPDHFNVINSVHGGALYTLLDSTGGATAASYGKRVTTLSSNVVFMNAVRKPMTIYGVGRCIKPGRKISVVDVKIVDEKGVCYVQGSFTFFTLD